MFLRRRGDIKSRTPADYRKLPFGQYFFDGSLSEARVIGGCKYPVRARDIQKMVGDSTVKIGFRVWGMGYGVAGDFACAEVQPSVNLAGIGGDNLAIELPGKRDCEVRFTGCGRAEDYQNLMHPINLAYIDILVNIW